MYFEDIIPYVPINGEERKRLIEDYKALTDNILDKNSEYLKDTINAIIYAEDENMHTKLFDPTYIIGFKSDIPNNEVRYETNKYIESKTINYKEIIDKKFYDTSLFYKYSETYFADKIDNILDDLSDNRNNNSERILDLIKQDMLLSKYIEVEDRDKLREQAIHPLIYNHLLKITGLYSWSKIDKNLIIEYFYFLKEFNIYDFTNKEDLEILIYELLYKHISEVKINNLLSFYLRLELDDNNIDKELGSEILSQLMDLIKEDILKLKPTKFKKLVQDIESSKLHHLLNLNLGKFYNKVIMYKLMEDF